ncbi:hypothetical protein C1645_751351, partial [Glomus cerebriforme]
MKMKIRIFLLFLTIFIIATNALPNSRLDKRESCEIGGDSACKLSCFDGNACCCTSCGDAQQGCKQFCHCACDCFPPP